MELPPNLIEALQRLPPTAREDVEELLWLLEYLKLHPADVTTMREVQELCRSLCLQYGPPWMA